MAETPVTTVSDTEAAVLRNLWATTLQRNFELVVKLTKDVSEQAALNSLLEDGSHMNWLAGHLTANRGVLLRMLGGERVRAKEIDMEFGYGSKPQQEASVSLAEHLAAYTAAHEALVTAVASATGEQLAASNDKGPLKDRFEFYLWHETYHLGQLMLYRRAAGLASPIG